MSGGHEVTVGVDLSLFELLQCSLLEANKQNFCTACASDDITLITIIIYCATRSKGLLAKPGRSGCLPGLQTDQGFIAKSDLDRKSEDWFSTSPATLQGSKQVQLRSPGA